MNMILKMFVQKCEIYVKPIKGTITVMIRLVYLHLIIQLFHNNYKDMTGQPSVQSLRSCVYAIHVRLLDW